MAISKAERQDVRSLKRKADRWEKRRVIVEGVKCIEELLQSNWIPERIYFTPAWKSNQAESSLTHSLQGLTTMEVSAKDMEMMSAMKQPPGILAVACLPDSWGAMKHVDGSWLYLDDLADPGNVGTLIRLADWFGMAGVVLSPGCADPLNPKTIQSSMGSVFHIPMVVAPFDLLQEEFKRLVVSLDAGGASLTDFPKSPLPSLIVIGSESHGVSQECSEGSHHVLAIPGAGRAESLNASVAGAIAVAHFMK